MKKASIPFLLGALFLSMNLLAKPPIKFGSVSQEELTMTVYDKDSSAAAVVLCDYGVFNLQDYMFTRIVRIKILKKEGLYLADDVYPGIEKTEIRGKTYNLVNGEIEEVKLKNESIFRERVQEDYYNLRITMPNVKVGSVFEIELRQFFPPATWTFQREIPVVWSELIMPQSQYFDLQRRYTGYLPLDITSSDRWVAKDMPAFKPEPYINSTVNYMTKFDIDLERIAIPGVYYKEYATNWNAVARRLEESEWFGAHLKMAIYLNDIAKEITGKYSTDAEKIEAAYEAIKTRVKWNQLRSLYSSTNVGLGTILRDGIGNSADINLLLVNLLKKLDYEAYPVILSTRDNGVISAVYPSSSRLNYVIAYTKIGDKEYFLDATVQDLPLGMLPYRCLNGLAQIVKKDIAVAVYLKPEGKEKKTEMLTLQLNEDLSLSGSFSAKHEGYAAYDTRLDYKTFNSEEAFVESREEKHSGLDILSYSIANIDSINKPIIEKCELSLENYAYELDNKIYLNPLLHLQITESPFVLEKRTYPVDFTVPKSTSYTLNISLPAGYKVEQLPSPIKMGLPDNSVALTYVVNSSANKVSVIMKMDINKEVFYVTEYEQLREFFSQAIKKLSEPLIISKS